MISSIAFEKKPEDANTTQDRQKQAEIDRARDEMDRLIKLEHMKAIISDAFWYFICTEYKMEKDPQKYAAHNEFLLDRMAANYVSYTLVEDPYISEKTKDKFFTKFYNHLAQSVFHCLKTAFPKNRNTIETSAMKRKLLNTFSELFTGMQITTAKWRHWTDQKSTSSKTEEEPLKLSQAFTKKSGQSGKRQTETLRYSPLVERYLMTHKYETSNNVKGWKIQVNQNQEASKEMDRKFKMYYKIADEAEALSQQLLEEREKLEKSAKKRKEEADKLVNAFNKQMH